MTDTCESRPIDVAIVAVTCVIPNGIRILVTRRHPNGALPSAWELPGGKAEPGEDPARAAARELAEETGLAATTRDGPLEPLVTVPVPGPTPPIRLHAFVHRMTRDQVPNIELDGPVDARWIAPEALADWPFPPGNRPVTDALIHWLSTGPLRARTDRTTG